MKRTYYQTSQKNQNIIPLVKLSLDSFNFIKGQTKSKRIFQADVSSKKQTNEFYFTTMKPQVDLFLLVFWRKLKTPKRHFEINWPLARSLLLLGISLPGVSREFQRGPGHSVYQAFNSTLCTSIFLHQTTNLCSTTNLLYCRVILMCKLADLLVNNKLLSG